MFAHGDKVQLLESGIKHLGRYTGRIGTVVHAQDVYSPYTGEKSQAVHVRFGEGERHIEENSSLFVGVQ